MLLRAYDPQQMPADAPAELTAPRENYEIQLLSSAREIYSAWRSLEEENGHTVPELDQLSMDRDLDNNADMMEQFLKAQPEFQADSPTVITRSERMLNFVETTNINRRQTERYLQLEEFVPDDQRQDYRQIVGLAQRIMRFAESTRRINQWLTQVGRQQAALLKRAREGKRLTPAEQAFYETYMEYRGSLNSVLHPANLRYESAISAYSKLGQIMEYIWQDTDRPLYNSQAPKDLKTVLAGYGSRYEGDTLDSYNLFDYVIQAGIDPYSIVQFAQSMRTQLDMNGNPVRNGEYREAVMNLAAWRERDVQEIAGLSRDLSGILVAASGTGADDVSNRLHIRMNAVSETARGTLIANFDKTFRKYFRTDQVRDGSALERIRVHGVPLPELVRAGFGDAPDPDRSLAKMELMMWVLVGEAVEIERVLADGTVKRVPLRVETDQPALQIQERPPEAAADVRTGTPARQAAPAGAYAQAGPQSVPVSSMQERRAQLLREFETTRLQGNRSQSGESLERRRQQPNIPIQDLDQARMQRKMQQEALALLREDGIYDVAAASVLGAGESVSLQRMTRELETYRMTLTGENRQALENYLAILQVGEECLGDFRRSQEFLNNHPRIANGWYIAGQMNAEATRIYEGSSMLAELLRYGMGVSGAADQNAVLSGEKREVLERFLQAEGVRLDDVLRTVQTMRAAAPESGNRFAAASGIPMNLCVGDDSMLAPFLPDEARPGVRMNTGLLGPEQRQWAAQNFDLVFDQVFGKDERRQMAERGMDIYDNIYVEGRSLNDLYRQTPERRSYERLESDMKCRLIERVMHGQRIDVAVTDGNGARTLLPLLPYASRNMPGMPRRPVSRRNEREDLYRSMAEDSAARLEETLKDPAVRTARRDHILWGQGQGIPGRKGFAAPADKERHAVLPVRMPVDDTDSTIENRNTASLRRLWDLQQVPANRRAALGRLRVKETDSGEEVLEKEGMLTLGTSLYNALTDLTGVSGTDPELMRKCGFAGTEQMFYIDGIPAEEFVRSIPDYADMVPDYRPDSAYMRILRGEIIGATLGAVHSVDIIRPAVDPLTGTRILQPEELHVDYTGYQKAGDVTWMTSYWMERQGRNEVQVAGRVDLASRQNYFWNNERPQEGSARRNLANITPITESARNQRQSRISDDLRSRHTPRIRLTEGAGGELTPQQQDMYRRLRDPGRIGGHFMERRDRHESEREELRTAAESLYGEIMRQIGIDEREKQFLMRTGVIHSEGELFYIDGVPAGEYVERKPAYRDLKKGSAEYEQILRAEIAAAAINGGHIVEIGRVVMDAEGRLRGGVTDVHVDLSPISIPEDDHYEEEANTALRSYWDPNRRDRRIHIRRDMQSRIDHAAGIAYGNNTLYQTAAQRFDPNREDVVNSYMGAPGAQVIDAHDVGRLMLQMGAKPSRGEAHENRMFCSLAQAYLLSQNQDIHMADLMDPSRFAEEKKQAGMTVAAAIHEAVYSGNFAEIEKLMANMVLMVNPLTPQEGVVEIPEELARIRRLDMRQEMIIAMGLDPRRQPAYSQEELTRIMGAPENSARVSAFLAAAGHMAGDINVLFEGRSGLVYSLIENACVKGNKGSAAALKVRRETIDGFLAAARALQTAGEGEEEWLRAAINDRGLDSAQIGNIVNRRIALENVRNLLAADGNVVQNAGRLREFMDERHIARTEAYIQSLGQRPDIREMIEKPLGALGLSGPSVAVGAGLRLQRGQVLDALIGLAGQSGDVTEIWSTDDAARGVFRDADHAVTDYAAAAFDQMFGPYFSQERRAELESRGMDSMDKIYINGRSMNDLWEEKYRGVPYDEACKRMKTEFMVQMLKGARIDAAVMRDGVETVAAVAVDTDIRRIQRNAWLTAPAGSAGQFIEPAAAASAGPAVPAMPRQMAASVYSSRWASASMTPLRRLQRREQRQFGAVDDSGTEKRMNTAVKLFTGTPAEDGQYFTETDLGTLNGLREREPVRTLLDGERQGLRTDAMLLAMARNPRMTLADLTDPGAFAAEKKQAGEDLARALAAHIGEPADSAAYRRIMDQIRDQALRIDGKKETVALFDGPESPAGEERYGQLASNTGTDIYAIAARRSVAGLVGTFARCHGAEMQMQGNPDILNSPDVCMYLLYAGYTVDQVLASTPEQRQEAAEALARQRQELEGRLNEIERNIRQANPDAQDIGRRVETAQNAERSRFYGGYYKEIADRLQETEVPDIDWTEPAQILGVLPKLQLMAGLGKAFTDTSVMEMMNREEFYEQFPLEEAVQTVDRIYGMQLFAETAQKAVTEENAAGRLAARLFASRTGPLMGGRPVREIFDTPLSRISSYQALIDVCTNMSESSLRETLDGVVPFEANVSGFVNNEWTRETYRSNWLPREKFYFRLPDLHGRREAAERQTVRPTGGLRLPRPEPWTAPDVGRTGADRISSRRQAESEWRLFMQTEQDSRVGWVPDSEACTVEMEMPGTGRRNRSGDFLDEFYRLHSAGEENLRRIFTSGEQDTSGEPDPANARLMEAAASYINNVALNITYANANPERDYSTSIGGQNLDYGRHVIPTRLQKEILSGMKLGPDDISGLFFIDGMTVEEYAGKIHLDVGLPAGSDREKNRQAVLAAAILSGEHHVDMIRAGLDREDIYEQNGERRLLVRSDQRLVYKTGVAEVQADLSLLDGRERFYQTRPSRKAERFYKDESGREERHERIRRIADENLLTALTSERIWEEEAQRTEVERAIGETWRESHAPQAAVGETGQPAQQTEAREAGSALHTAAGPASQPAQQTEAREAGPVPHTAAGPTSQPAQQTEARASDPVPHTVVGPAGSGVQPSANPPEVSAKEVPGKKKVGLAGVMERDIRTDGGKETSSSKPRSSGPAGVRMQTERNGKVTEQVAGEVTEQTSPAPQQHISGQQPVPQPRSAEDSAAAKTMFSIKEIVNTAPPEYSSMRALMEKGEKDDARFKEEYDLLTELFSQVPENGAVDLTFVRMPSGKPKKMSDENSGRFREFLAGVTNALKNGPQAAGYATAVTAGILSEALLQTRIPQGMDLSNPKKIDRYQKEFHGLKVLTEVLSDIQQTLSPGKPDDRLEYLHTICAAAEDVSNPKLPPERRCAARYILDRVSNVMNSTAANEGPIAEVFMHFDRGLIEVCRERTGRAIEEGFKQYIRNDPGFTEAYITASGVRVSCPLDEQSYTRGGKAAVTGKTESLHGPENEASAGKNSAPVSKK